MTVKYLKPANDSGTPDSQEAVATAPGTPKPDVEYEGRVILVIPLNKAFLPKKAFLRRLWTRQQKNALDQTTNHLTRISRQIKNTPGGSVVHSGMLGNEYLIEAHFKTPVSLDAVLNGVSDWEDFEHQGQQVKNYQKRPWALFSPSCLKESKDTKHILVTL